MCIHTSIVGSGDRQSEGVSACLHIFVTSTVEALHVSTSQGPFLFPLAVFSVRYGLARLKRWETSTLCLYDIISNTSYHIML